MQRQEDKEAEIASVHVGKRVCHAGILFIIIMIKHFVAKHLMIGVS